MVLPADMMDEVLARLRPAIVVLVRYRIDGLTGAAAQLPQAEVVFRPYRTRLVKPRLTLTPKWMDGFERHIQFFDSHYVKYQDLKQHCRARAVPRSGIGCQMACKPGSVPVSR